MSATTLPVSRALPGWTAILPDSRIRRDNNWAATLRNNRIRRASNRDAVPLVPNPTPLPMPSTRRAQRAQEVAVAASPTELARGWKQVQQLEQQGFQKLAV